MNRRLTTSLPFCYLIVSCLLSNHAHAQDLELNPKNGYTHEQATALFSKFDLATWNLDGGDLSRFAYINTSQFFPHALIHRDGQVSQLQSAPNAAIGKTKVKTYAGVMTLDQWTAGHLDGCIVILDGKIVYEKYPRMRPRDTPDSRVPRKADGANTSKPDRRNPENWFAGPLYNSRFTKPV